MYLGGSSSENKNYLRDPGILPDNIRLVFEQPALLEAGKSLRIFGNS
jgi:hypothetical protein